MRKGISGSLVVLCCGALLMAGGCAHKEQVKPSEPVAATQPAPAPAPVEAAPEAPKVEAPAPAPVPETKTQEAAVQPETPKPAPAPEPVAAELDKVYFAFDSAALSAEARETLSKNAQYLAKNAQVKVRVEGNCDERGSDEYNMALGERRAKAAKDYLVTLGVAADRLSTISYGLERPAVDGHDEAAWSKNRRDEFVVIK